MYDDYLVRFRNKVDAEAATSAKIGDIIAQSTSKVEVLLEGNVNAIPVIFINDDKESGTESIMYSYSKNNVSVGKYINFLGDNYLVYKEIKNIKRENYIDSFRLVLCNILFTFNGSDVKAYFRGSLRSVQSEETMLSQRLGVESFGEAYIIIPSGISLTVNTPLTINGKGWRTTFIDETTNPGIKYVALEEFTIIDTAPPIMLLAQEEIPVAAKELTAGTINKFATENGYIKADKTINIVKRTINNVEFIVPFGTKEINIEIKINKEIVSEYYIVRG